MTNAANTNIATIPANANSTDDLENQEPKSSSSPQKQQQQVNYKLFSHLNGFKANTTSNNSSSNNNNTISNDASKLKYFSKMQVKATHLKSTGA